MNPKLRSALRSLLFQVAPVIVAYIIANEGAFFIALGLTAEQASVIALLVGTLARAYLPNVISAR